MSHVKDNIWKNYLLLFVQGWWFILPIFILYFQRFDISFTQLGSFESIAAGLFLVLTIPCGAFSDLVSRKFSVLLGSFFTGTGMLVIGLGSSYGVFLLGYCLWAIGDGFLINARGAMMYDSVIQIGKEKDYLKISGRANLFSVISLVISGFLGPILFSHNLRLPWLLTGSLWIGSTIIILVMIEPKKQLLDYTFKNYMMKMRDGIKYCIHEKQIFWSILFIVGMNIPLAIFNDVISQSFLLEIGFTEQNFKFIYPIIYGLASLTASQSHRIEKLLGETGSFIFIVVIHTLGLLVMAVFQTPGVLSIVIILYISRDFRWIFGDTYLNRYAQSHIRATILSIMTMVQSLFLAFTFVLGGYLADNIGIQKTLLILSGFTACTALLLMIFRPKKDTSPTHSLNNA